jgi:phage tail-like protein
MAQDGDRRDPYAGFNFRMEIDGIEVAGFKEISGGEMTTAVIEYADGDDQNYTVRKIPGRTNYSNITFKRGISEGVELWEWCETISDWERTIERKDVTIQLLDNTGESQKTYNLFSCWPCRYKGPDLNAGDDSLAIEEIEFAFEKLAIED